MRGWTIFPSLTNVAYTLARQHCSFLNFAPPRPLSPLHPLPITTHSYPDHIMKTFAAIANLVQKTIHHRRRTLDEPVDMSPNPLGANVNDERYRSSFSIASSSASSSSSSASDATTKSVRFSPESHWQVFPTYSAAEYDRGSRGLRVSSMWDIDEMGMIRIWSHRHLSYELFRSAPCAWNTWYYTTAVW